jgi:uncharacterized protein YecA (UPF0149 family)
MFTREEEVSIKKFLSLAPVPDISFTFHEFSGFLFGLAITPEVIPFEEWGPIPLGELSLSILSPEDTKEPHTLFENLQERLMAGFYQEQLTLPFDINTLKEKDISMVFEWVSGFEEALVLREELWDPQEYSHLPEKRKEELLYAMIGIQGIVEPGDILNYFDDLSENELYESYPEIAASNMSQESKIQLYLLASLPLCIDTLQNHARYILLKRSNNSSSNISSIHSQTKKYLSENINPGKQQRGTKKDNIIHIDFKNPHNNKH